jgi:O-antigen/teichoic acid export membrane protein
VALAFSELVFARVVELAIQAFQAHDQLHKTANIGVGLSLARLAAVGGFAASGVHRSASTWSLWYAGATIVVAAASVCLMLKQLGMPRYQAGDARRHVRDSVAFSIGQASKTVYADIDKLMLSRIVGAGAAGIYTAAYRVVALAFTPVQAFVYSHNTRFYREGQASASRVWRFACRPFPVLAGYSALVGVGLFVAAPILPYILGTSFASAVNALRWLCLLPLVQTVHLLYGDALMGTGRQGVRGLLQLGTAGVNVGLNLWLIPRYSYRGAAVASIVAEGLLGIGVVVLFRIIMAAEASTAAPAQ